MNEFILVFKEKWCNDPFKGNWESTEEKYPEFDDVSEIKDKKKYLVRVVSGSAIQEVYYAIGYLTSPYKFNMEMDWVRVTHWTPVKVIYS